LSAAQITADVSAINLPLTVGGPKRARTLAKATNQPSLPFHTPSFPSPQSEENSCIYKGLGVKCPHRNNGSAECVNTQLSLFNRSVIAHAAADEALLCAIPLAESKRRMMQAREQRGLQLVAGSQLRSEGVWIVPSQSSPKTYTVDLNSIPPSCNCPDHKEHDFKCKHIFAAEYAAGRERGETVPPAPEVVKPTYKQAWHEYNLAQTNEKAKFLELLYELTRGVANLPRKAGAGRSRLPLGDMIFCAVFKSYSLFSGRRFISDLREAQQRGYISCTPHFNSIFNYLELAEMTACLQQLIALSALPLKAVECDFAVDSSGFTTGRFVRWLTAKYDEPKLIERQDWVKVHLICGVKTNVVTAAEVSDRNGGDSPYFAPLVEATAANFPVQTVTADKAYSSSKNLQLVLLKGGTPYIAFKSNATAADPRSSAVWKRMLNFYVYNQDWFMAHYHKRSNVESTFSMIKVKFGERIRSQTYTAQVNEVLCKVLCHNLCCVIQSMYELGVDVDFQAEMLG
jgi:transposase